MRDRQTYESWLVRAIACITLGATFAMTVSSVHADGAEIAYIANDNRSIHVVHADGSDDHQLLVTPSNAGDVAWSPDGKLLAYTVPNTNGLFGAQRLYVYDTSTERTTELKSSVGTYGPIAFFPDGKRLAGVSNKSDGLHCGGPAVGIDIASGQGTPLFIAGCYLTRIQVAPDGATLISTSHGGDPSSAVWDVSVASGEPSYLTDPGTGPLAFSGEVAPDNQTLAYIAQSFDFASPRGLVVANRDGSNPHVVWNGAFGTLAFAPDGGHLAVTVLLATSSTAVAKDEDIWVIGYDGSNAHRIASGHNPAWRPGQAGIPSATLAGTVAASPPTAQQGSNAAGAATQSAVTARADATLAQAQSGPDIDWNAVVTGGSDPRIAVQPPAACNLGVPCLVVSGAALGGGNVGDLYGNPAFDRITYGDLDGDGQAEALIPLNSGGTAGLSGALLYRLGDSTPRLVYAGGDVGGAAAYIDPSAHVVFTLFKVGLPTCCPSSMLLASFKLVDDTLVEQTECRYTPQGDYTIVRSPCTTLATSGPPPLAQAAAAPDAQPPPADAALPAPAPDTAGVPETLTDSVQSDILRAITRANNAWARANEFLDSATLNGNVAGQALRDDLAHVDKLRAQGRMERNHETAFSVIDVSLDGPGQAVVHTHETWYAEIYDSGGRRLLQRTAPASYDETYIVEYQNGGWIVATNDLH